MNYWIKTEIDSNDIILEEWNDRFKVKVNIKFWHRLWILFGGDYYLIIKDISVLYWKIKRKDQEE